MNEESTSLTMKQVRTMQIIWFAMLAGVSTFAVVAVFLHREAPANLVLSRFLLFFAPASILMSFLVPAMIGRTAIRRVLPELRSEDAEVAYPRLVAFYQTTLIVALALLQGSAFFALVAYQLEGVWWALAIAGIVVFLMLLHFPTLGRVEAWCRTWHETIRMGAL
jgi:hypothetical protein